MIYYLPFKERTRILLSVFSTFSTSFVGILKIKEKLYVLGGIDFDWILEGFGQVLEGQKPHFLQFFAILRMQNRCKHQCPNIYKKNF